MSVDSLKITALTPIHEGLGAKMASFAGYNMPISYTNIQEEHLCVRKGVGVFDVSHMGEFIIKGKDALAWIQYFTSNNVANLAINQAQYSCMPNEDGGIIDDLLVYRLPEDKCNEGETAFMLVVNAGNIQKDKDWMLSHKGDFEATFEDISNRSGLLAVQGPKAVEVLQKITDVNLSEIEYYHFTKGSMAGIDNIVISATGYTGSGGFELYVPNGHLADLWHAVFEAGKDADIKPIGLGARDTLRLEKGFCLYGNDIDDTTSPIAAGLSWITKVDVENFVGKQDILNVKADKPTQRLKGFKLDGKRIPRHDYLIENEAGETIGKVTSGTFSPSLQQPIGMGYIDTAYKYGSTVNIVFGKKRLPAVLTKVPFL